MFSVSSDCEFNVMYVEFLAGFTDANILELKKQISIELKKLNGDNFILVVEISDEIKNDMWIELEKYVGNLSELSIKKVVRIIGSSKKAFFDFSNSLPNFSNVEIEYSGSLDEFNEKIKPRDLVKVYRPVDGIETNFEVRTTDTDISFEDYQKLPKHKIYIILDNLRSAFNVGAIFRLCDTMRVSGLLLCGYTAHPPNKKIIKTSLGTVDFVPWIHFDRTVDAVKFLQDHGTPVWAAETTSLAEKYNEIKIPESVGLVFGNEALGVSDEVMQKCDKFIEIPTFGYKNSLNVAASCGVIGYHIIEKM